MFACSIFSFFLTYTAHTDIYTYLHPLSLHASLPTSHSAWQKRPRPLLGGEEAVAAVAGESLVGAVTGEGDRHFLSRQLTDTVSGKGGGVGEGFVESVDRKSTRLNSSQ